jgi:YidC/Oxa1 family membrane protein insertase
LSSIATFLTAFVQKEPGVIVGPIATVFGYVIDFIFNIIYTFTAANSLGLSIVMLTIVFRFLMLPLAVRSQKSMMKMQKLNPEVEKIRAKYGGSKDPEITQKMNMEIQTLYSKNKVNPLSGCLPLLIQMPLFFGISYIMQQSFLFIPTLNELYADLSTKILSACVADGGFYTYLKDTLVHAHLPNGMELDVRLVENLSKAINKFSTADWQNLLGAIPKEFLEPVAALVNHKNSVEMFFGLPLIDAVGFMWPGVLIPILAGVTSLATSWLSSRASNPADEKARSQQRMMTIVMPIIFAVMTFSLPGGVGIYWITGSIFQIVQQIIMNQRAGIPLFKKKDTVE